MTSSAKDKKNKTLSASLEWDSGLEKEETVSACGLVEDAEILLSPTAHSKIETLLFTIDTEWLAFLVGKQEGTTVTISDIVVPEQEVAHSYCETVEAEPEGYVGIIHSHHTLGVFRSTTDKDSVDTNNVVSIIVGRKNGTMEYDAVMRSQTPCGKPIQLKAKMNTMLLKSIVDWVDGIKPLLKPRVYKAATVGNWSYPQYNYAKYYGSLNSDNDKKVDTKKDDNVAEDKTYETNPLMNTEYELYWLVDSAQARAVLPKAVLDDLRELGAVAFDLCMACKGSGIAGTDVCEYCLGYGYLDYTTAEDLEMSWTDPFLM